MAHLPDLPRNRLNTLLGRLDRLPAAWRLRGFDLVFGRFTPFYGTLGVRAVEITPYRVTLTLRDRRRTRNHVGSIHAVAAILPAEYAAGLLVGQHVPDGRVVVVGAIRMDLAKPWRGTLRATATLAPDVGAAIRRDPKGSLEVPVEIEDDSGPPCISGVMRMAWFERRSAPETRQPKEPQR